MDPDSATRGLAADDRGFSSLQFLLGSALAFLIFVALVNLVVVQYGKGAIRAALEQGARAGSVGGVIACENTANAVRADLLGGRMSDDLVVSCTVEGSVVEASASVTFESWTPFAPDFSFSLTTQAVVEP